MFGKSKIILHLEGEINNLRNQIKILQDAVGHEMDKSRNLNNLINGAFEVTDTLNNQIKQLQIEVNNIVNLPEAKFNTSKRSAVKKLEASMKAQFNKNRKVLRIKKSK